MLRVHAELSSEGIQLVIRGHMCFQMDPWWIILLNYVAWVRVCKSGLGIIYNTI